MAVTEYRPLKEVLLYIPGPDIATHEDAESVLFQMPVRVEELRRTFGELVAAYIRQGIRPLILRPFDDTRAPNLMFMRDTFVPTSYGPILGWSPHAIRQTEAGPVEAALKRANRGFVGYIFSPATLEGADVLWTKEHECIVGVGNRTNEKAVEQLESLLPRRRIIPVPVPKNVQHLLGCLQIVDQGHAVLRECAAYLKDVVRDLGYHVDVIPENTEMQSRWAFNFVVIAPGRIIAAAGNPKTNTWLNEHGIDIVETVHQDELNKAAGGIACATGILHRE